MKRLVIIVCFILSLSLIIRFAPSKVSAQANNSANIQTNSQANSQATSQTKDEDVAIYQSVLDLTFPFTIMCVAAHPDDEDSDGLAYYRMKYGARTVLVTATRGEGGQNSQGPELYEDLGVIRVKETAAMANRLSTIAVNLAMPDFGFSKTSQETFKVWNRREALRRLVFAIRSFRPDIIITVHDRKTGHGHHQATRLLAEEAYDLASDRNAYAEQFTGLNRLEPWQVKRLFARTLSKTSYDTEFDANEIANVYSQPYSQIGYQSRLEHRTQGPWPVIELKGERMIRYNLVKSVDEDFRRWFLLWQGFAEPTIYAQIQPIIFDEQNNSPEKVAKLPSKELVSRLTKALNLVRNYIKEEGKNDFKAKELAEKIQKSLLLVTKISLKVTTSVTTTFPGQDITATLTVNNPSSLPIEVKSVATLLPEFWEYEEKTKLNTNIEAGASSSQELTVKIGSQARTSLPNSAHLYDLDFLEPQIKTFAKISLPELSEPITVLDQARVDVSPQIEMEITPNNNLVNITDSTETNTYPFQIKINNKTQETILGRVRLDTVAPVQITPQEQQVKIEPRSTIILTFFVAVGRPVPEGLARFPVALFDDYGRELISSELRMNLIRVRVADVEVAYLRTFDFTLPQTLNFYGVKNKEISVSDIMAGNLTSYYDTIILDNRAYLAFPDLVKANQKLLNFVRDGGTLIVLYQRPSDWNGKNLSPYPIKLGDDRVTDENASVKILEPEHAVMSLPNKITPQDFNGWIQERGLNFPSEWDERYYTLISCADPGEEELKGGLLVARHGRGQYIYTSYVIYRQLRAFNPGAFHLFANMISLPKTR